jgi:hypothetical protein
MTLKPCESKHAALSLLDEMIILGKLLGTKFNTVSP